MKPVVFVFWVSLCLAATSAAQQGAVVFPRDSGVADVTQAPYLAVPDGKTDCTAAIQQALSDGKSLIYLPAGTYIITDTLRWGKGEKRQILQGAGRDLTIIRLAEAAANFSDPDRPKEMVWTGTAPAQRFRNSLRDLTLDAGSHAGAIGLRYIGNNQAGIERLGLRGQGPIGLDLGYSDEQGPCLIKDVRIEGFKIGVSMAHAVNSVTFQGLDIQGAAVAGVYNGGGQVANIRHYRYLGSGLAIDNAPGPGLITLVESSFEAQGDGTGLPAIRNQAGLFARDVTTRGFGAAIEQNGREPVPDGKVDEFLSDEGFFLFGQKPRSLRMPVVECPEVPLDPVEAWVNVCDFGPPRKFTLVQEIYYKENTQEPLPGPPGGLKKEVVVDDWSQALQKAIDQGASTVYFPADGTDYYICGPVYLRKKIRRIIGCESSLGRMVQHTIEPTLYQPESRPEFILEDGEAPAVVVERFNTWYAAPRFVQKSKRSLVVKNMSLYDLETTAGSGDVFLEDVRASRIRVNRSRLFAWQLNTEGHNDPRTVNDGGQVWVLGLKTENDPVLASVLNGGTSEYLGTFAYANRANKSPKEMFIADNGNLSFTVGEWVTRNGKPFDVIVRETRDRETKELRHEEVPRRGRGSSVVLYSTQSSKP